MGFVLYEVGDEIQSVSLKNVPLDYYEGREDEYE